MSGFHGAFATGVACQQGTLTLPDTWFRPPLGDLLVLQLLRPDSSNLPCLYSTFHLEYPLVLSRFSLCHEGLKTYPHADAKQKKKHYCGLTEKRNKYVSVLWPKTLYQKKCKKRQSDNTTTSPKRLITKRLRTDLWRLVWVITVTKMVRLTRFMGPTFLTNLYFRTCRSLHYH